MIKVNSREDFLKELKTHLSVDCVVVEIGVLNGDFSKMILDIINPANLILVDPYKVGKELYGSGFTTSYSTDKEYENILVRFSDEISTGKVFVNKKYSYDAVECCPETFIDFIYHDGSHRYEDIKKDLIDWLPKMKEGSVICGHDYIGDKDFGVIKAVDEFRREHRFVMIIFNENGGDWALKRL